MTVDVDSLSQEQRDELLRKLAAKDDEATEQPKFVGERKSPVVQEVVVDGVVYSINRKRLIGWKATNLMVAMSDDKAPEQERFFAAVQFFNYVMGAGISKIVEACGGEDASTQDVLDLASRILKAAQPKN